MLHDLKTPSHRRPQIAPSSTATPCPEFPYEKGVLYFNPGSWARAASSCGHIGLLTIGSQENETEIIHALA